MEYVERCLFDLRRGLPIRLQDASADVLAWPLEYLDETALARLRHVTDDTLSLVVTQHRMASLKNGNGHKDGVAPVRITIDPTDSANDVIRRACAPNADIGKARIKPTSKADIDSPTLFLMRRALLIPAAVVATIAPEARAEMDADVEARHLLSITPAAVRDFQKLQPLQLKRISEADVPLADAPHTRFIVFREPDGMREHIAILIGDSSDWPESIPVRLHSACLTGDLFGSLRCDCGEQLRSSVSAIANRGGGVLLYLAQEGRGIGLANKMRAYHLQDDGLDTVDADQVLGFGEDERRYSVAGQILAALDIHQIDLLTNNPAKIQAMNQDGITVSGREAIFGRLTPENRRYLNAKATRAGHWLDSLLGDTAES